jgi:DNA-binding transcriptional ArsR family regulator
MSDPSTVRLDSGSLRVLAHPLRSRLLSELRLHGPATATDLARRLGTNTGATSYHLRRLESVGLVEDTGEGAGKRRTWAPSTHSHEYVASDFADDPEATAALSWLSHHYVQQMAERMGAWYDAEQSWPAQWRDACGMGDDAVLVTAEQLSDLTDEIWELVRRYREAGAGDHSARRVLIGTAATPVDPGEPPA